MFPTLGVNFEIGSADSMSSWFLKRGWVAATQNWQVKDMAIIIEIKSELGRGGMTADNFGFPAGGIRCPHAADIWGGVREPMVVRRHMTPHTPRIIFFEFLFRN